MRNNKENLLYELRDIHRQLLLISSRLWVSGRDSGSMSWGKIAKDKTSLRIHEIIKMKEDDVYRHVYTYELRQLVVKSDALLVEANVLLSSDMRILDQ